MLWRIPEYEFVPPATHSEPSDNGVRVAENLAVFSAKVELQLPSLKE